MTAAAIEQRAVTVRFRATLATGSVVTGSIQGAGGRLGNGCMYLGYQRAAEAAQRDIDKAQRQAADGRPLGIFEPEPGCVGMYPTESTYGDGEIVHVPLVGTVFEVVTCEEAIDLSRKAQARAEYREACYLVERCLQDGRAGRGSHEELAEARRRLREAQARL